MSCPKEFLEYFGKVLVKSYIPGDDLMAERYFSAIPLPKECIQQAKEMAKENSFTIVDTSKKSDSVVLWHRTMQATFYRQ
jgi:hypothetical protein